MLERIPFWKRLHDWLYKPIEIRVFDLHKGIVEIKTFAPLNLKAEVLEESEKPRKIFQQGHSLGVTLQENWLNSICNGKPEDGLVTVKWVRHRESKKCAILIEGANDESKELA